MKTLHLVSVAPTAGSALADSLRAADRGDTLLLLQDGVLAAAASAACATLLDAAIARGVLFYVLLPDADARGIAHRLHAACRLVDDNGFVELTERHPRIVSWF